MTSEYDSEAGIEAHTTDLAALRRLFRLRHAAGYELHERLRQWIVLGRWFLDTCGNVAPCSFSHTRVKDMSWLADSLPTVVESDTVLKVMKGLMMTASLGVRSHLLPPDGACCGECGRGWTVPTAHDFTETEGGGPFHLRCWSLAQERGQLAQYRVIANDAGFEKALLDAVPSGYYALDPPWVSIRSHLGCITLGWRKRVLSIDWQDNVDARVNALFGSGSDNYEQRKRIREALDGNKLFADEETTKTETLVHAWSHAKAAEYLKTLRLALQGLDEETPR